MGYQNRRILFWFQIRLICAQNVPKVIGKNNGKKVQAFFDTPILIIKEKICWGHIITFAKAQMLKNGTLSDILQTVKNYCFAQSYHSSFEPLWRLVDTREKISSQNT
jgi:hypothetical protein